MVIVWPILIPNFITIAFCVQEIRAIPGAGSNRKFAVAIAIAIVIAIAIAIAMAMAIAIAIAIAMAIPGAGSNRKFAVGAAAGKMPVGPSAADGWAGPRPSRADGCRRLTGAPVGWVRARRGLTGAPVWRVRARRGR